LPVWFVDNVVTTGTTLKAASLAFGTGGGVVYADASSHSLIRASGGPFKPHANWLG
jgi:hypothetical protein